MCREYASILKLEDTDRCLLVQQECKRVFSNLDNEVSKQFLLAHNKRICNIEMFRGKNTGTFIVVCFTVWPSVAQLRIR